MKICSHVRVLTSKWKIFLHKFISVKFFWCTIGIMLGSALTLLLICAYNKHQLLNRQPFYHMLRNSIIRPFSDARENLAKDFKGIILRNLPPTNYEHPISDSSTEMTEVEANIYEEITQ
jgi:hypothetical protein